MDYWGPTYTAVLLQWCSGVVPLGLLAAAAAVIVVID